jgi:hypothetical protein
MDILVTNNPRVEAKYRGIYRVESVDASLLEILIRARDLVHLGHRLLTHPLSGSVKPNETRYKTVLVSGKRGLTDPQSVGIIEESMAAVRKFPHGSIPARYWADLQTVDLSLIDSALNNSLHKGGQHT